MNDLSSIRPPPDSDAAAARRAWAAARLGIESGRHWVGPDGAYSRWPSRVLHVAVAIFVWGLGLIGLGRWGLRNALAPKLVELEVAFPTLPAAFDGYRILHLTDTHLDGLPELASVAARTLDGVVVDMLALTGDVLADPGAPTARAVAPLGEVIARLVVRERRLAVLGNHDPAAMADALEAAGFEVLLNRSVAVERDGERIGITGLDDVHYFYTDAAREALREAPRDDGAAFRIALVHSAEMADHASAEGIAFYLCGHTHGGQICLPGGRPLVTKLRRCRHAASGSWRDGAMRGYTSRGLGISGHRMRFNCPSEMTLITLRRGPEPAGR